MYMVFLCLRALFGPSLVFGKIEFISSILGFDFNLRNIATIIGVLVSINGVGVTFYTAINKTVPEEKKYCYLYMISILFNCVVLWFILPFTNTYQLIPVSCLTLLSCPLIKLCWKFIM